MKFTGELKFPDIDHPGVPVTFLIEGPQAELIVEGESLGRWSLFDIHARRLVASAFQIDLDGTEVTFVADDPIDFAYRGVEHMAATWATMKSRRIATRTLAVRKSRRGTIPSRIEDMRAAMEANLEAQTAPRQIAGEVAMPETTARALDTDVADAQPDWDQRDEAGSIPLVGVASEPEPVSEDLSEPEPVSQDVSERLSQDVPAPEPVAPVAATPTLLPEQQALLEQELERIAEERRRLEEDRQLAEQREANRIEAFRIEMARLEAEREELRRQAAELERRAGETSQPEPVPVAETEPEPEIEPESVFAPSVEEAATPTRSVLDLSDLEAPAEPTSVREPERRLEPPVRPSPVKTSPAPTPAPEPAMAGAARDRSGLMGAVRAAFKSSAKDHQHQFVEAPGGIGITRYVCEECGYVSISV